jgi:hypothetical protein
MKHQGDDDLQAEGKLPFNFDTMVWSPQKYLALKGQHSRNWPLERTIKSLLYDLVSPYLWHLVHQLIMLGMFFKVAKWWMQDLVAMEVFNQQGTTWQGVKIPS